MHNDLVSVVIPSYNRARIVARAVDSVLRQTHPHVEVLIVDDGSTDGTREVVAATYAGDRRVRYLHQENRGVSAARNAGIRSAGGEFVAFLDSDDVWKPWKLELQLACLRAYPEVGMVWSDAESVDTDGRVVEPKHLRTMFDAYAWFTTEQLFPTSRPLHEVAPQLSSAVGESRVYVGNVFSQMIMGNLVLTSTTLLRRERLERVGGFDESLRYSGEDHDFHLRTCREGPVGLVDCATITYQTGMGDRLTRPSYGIHLARNFLKTIAPVIEKERDRINLPDHMVTFVLAYALSWVGEEYFEMADYVAARAYLARSLTHRVSLRPAALLILSSLPPRTGQWLRRVYRRFRRRGESGETPER